MLIKLILECSLLSLQVEVDEVESLPAADRLLNHAAGQVAQLMAGLLDR